MYTLPNFEVERDNSNMELTTIDDLNDDCLKEIFSYLTFNERFITEEVCKRWKGISTQGWRDVRHLHMQSSNEKTNRKKKMLQRCGRFLKVLSITLVKNEEDLSLLQMISDDCPLLEDIDICFGSFMESDVFEYYKKQLPNVWSKLQQLNTVRLSSLEKEYMRSNFHLYATATTVNHISINDLKIRNLRHLYLEPMFVRGESIEDWKQLHLLTSLVLAECKISGGYLLGIRYLENLESLTLTRIPQIRDEHIALITNCSKLTKLKLNRLRYLTDSCFEYIGQLPNLQLLWLEELRFTITQKSIIKIRQIQSLHLSFVDFLSEGGIQLMINSTKIRCLGMINSIEKVTTVVRAVNEAIGRHKSSEKFTFIKLHSRLMAPIFVENMSPRLIIKEFPIDKNSYEKVY